MLLDLLIKMGYYSLGSPPDLTRGQRSTRLWFVIKYPLVWDLMLHPNNTKLLSLTLGLPLIKRHCNLYCSPFLVAISSASRLWHLRHSLPIPAQCRELDLNTDVFSRFHVYDRSVAIRGPYTIRHSEDRPWHQRLPIFNAPPRTQVPGYPITLLLLC